jgi:hypothetical protein
MPRSGASRRGCGPDRRAAGGGRLGRHRLRPEVRRCHLVRLGAEPGQLLDHRGRAGVDRARVRRRCVRRHVAGLRALPGDGDRPAGDEAPGRPGRPAPRVPGRHRRRRGRRPARVPGLVAGQPDRGAHRHRARHVGRLPGRDDDGPAPGPAAEPGSSRQRAERAGHRRAGHHGRRQPLSPRSPPGTAGSGRC